MCLGRFATELHVKGRLRDGKGSNCRRGVFLKCLFAALCVCELSGCTGGQIDATRFIRVLIYHPPLSLNPRRSIDGVGQNLGNLIFRGLTQIGSDMQILPDAAESWQTDPSGRIWRFKLSPGLKDHSQNPITASQFATCIESYLHGHPKAPLASAFGGIKTATALENELRLELNEPDPYLLQNLSLLRFFRTEKGGICSEPAPGEGIIGSGDYAAHTGMIRDLAPQLELPLISQRPDRSNLKFMFVKDDNTRMLLLLRGSADVLINAFSPSKYTWIEKVKSERFSVMSKRGVNVSYLGFNLRRSPTNDEKVRKAISLALSRKEIVEHWLRGLGSVANGFLAPFLPESVEGVGNPQNTEEAKHLLEESGFKENKAGIRLDLDYLCTPVREGYETALLVRDQLSKVGIRTRIRVVEPGVFFESLRSGKFDLFSSRWVGVQDASILQVAYHSKSHRNRTGFSDPEIDRELDIALKDTNSLTRKKALSDLQAKLQGRYAYFPLWFWNNVVVASRGLTGLDSGEISSSGAYGPLGKLRWK